MRCALCLLEGTKPTYQFAAVVAGYSLCENHLKEWAFSEHVSVVEWMIERKQDFVTAWVEAEAAADAEERASIEAAEADGTAPWLEDVIHPKSESVTVDADPTLIGPFDPRDPPNYLSDEMKRALNAQIDEALKDPDTCLLPDFEGDTEAATQHDPVTDVMDVVSVPQMDSDYSILSRVSTVAVTADGEEIPLGPGDVLATTPRRRRYGKSYKCTKCGTNHRARSKIGKEHKDFAE